MAQILGKAGRYVEAETVRRRRSMLTVCVCGVALVGTLGGFCLGSTFRLINPPPYVGSVILIVLCLGIWWMNGPFFRRLEAMEKEMLKMQRGAEGERTVATALERLPGEFRVVHDVSSDRGNLDHVVIGPTGVFVLDAKNWRGTVSPDGQGELLLNGKPLDRKYVRQFIGRVMGIKERVKALAPGIDLYFQAVFVFTSARVDAQWGSTGAVHCLREDQLYHYIVENKKTKKLEHEQVSRIAQAFLGLAHMETDFADHTTRVAPSARTGNHNIASGLMSAARRARASAQRTTG